ncbi:thiolase family protein, partial [Klebsiella pneumoniae]|uniref:thiolase family protein n=1 Tax=Klebsiella pneumoniae TaxID=573 RepID=UPI004044AA13
FSRDEHPRSTSLEALAKLRGVVRADGSVTAGNASGVNDGACAAVTRDLGLPDDAAHVNPNGGAIALGHPPGASGGRLAMTAAYQ